jgi:hypothetical protein
MIERKRLECIDYLQWLGTGELAAKMLFCNQATISRNCNEIEKLFNASLEREEIGRYTVIGDKFLLRLERMVHQKERFIKGHRMRLHKASSIEYFNWNPPIGWQSNPPSKYESKVDGAELISDYVVDASIMLNPQVSNLDRDRFTVFELFRSPLSLYCRSKNNLTNLKAVSKNEIAERAELTHFQRSPESVIKSTNQLHRSIFGQNAKKNEGKENSIASADQVFYAHGLAQIEKKYFLINYDIEYETSDYLVVSKENENQPRILELLDSLARGLRPAASKTQGFRVTI